MILTKEDKEDACRAIKESLSNEKVIDNNMTKYENDIVNTCNSIKKELIKIDERRELIKSYFPYIAVSNKENLSKLDDYYKCAARWADFVLEKLDEEK